MTPSVKDRLLASYVHGLLPAMAAVCGEAEARRALASALAEELARVGNMEFAERYAAMIGVGTPEMYLPRIVEVGGEPLLCGIRFYGGDQARPFVELVAGGTRGGDVMRDVAGAAAAGMTAFAGFGPRSARVLVGGGAMPKVGAGWRVEGDQLLAAARAGAMVGSGVDTDVGLEPARVDEAGRFVRAGYERLAAADPELRARVFPASEEDLAGCAEAGHLWWWTLGGERAGLLAARMDAVLGLGGLLMVEELVDARFAGRGTAAAAQRAVAKCLPAETLVLGTIDMSNIASRRAARRAGRMEVAGWWFVRPEAA